MHSSKNTRTHAPSVMKSMMRMMWPTPFLGMTGKVKYRSPRDAVPECWQSRFCWVSVGALTRKNVTRSCRITPWQSSFSQSDSVSVESEARLVRAFSYLREMRIYVKSVLFLSGTLALLKDKMSWRLYLDSWMGSCFLFSYTLQRNYLRRRLLTCVYFLSNLPHRVFRYH